jgi:hypothetical protein
MPPVRPFSEAEPLETVLGIPCVRQQHCSEGLSFLAALDQCGPHSDLLDLGELQL